MQGCPPTVFVSAGEASGDRYAAALLAELIRLVPGCRLHGIGGPALAAVGVRLVADPLPGAAVGILELLPGLACGLRALRAARRTIARLRPDLVLLVDCQGLNLPLARTARRLGVPVVYYIPPQDFLWHGMRTGRRIAAHTNLVLNIYRAGQEFYQRAGAMSLFVGHPVLERSGARPAGVPAGRLTVCLVPGARRQELRRLLPLFRATAELLYRSHPRLFIVVPAVSPEHARCLRAGLHGASFSWRVLEGVETRALAARCRLVLVKSGTAALEAALSGTPGLIAYRLHPLSWWLLARLGGLARRLPFIGLPNLLAGRLVMPEFLQSAATPQRLAAAARELLDDPAAHRRARRALGGLAKTLGRPGAARRAARATAALLAERTG